MPSASSVAPVNLMRRDVSPEALRSDVDYGMQVVGGFSVWAQGAGVDLRNKRALEIGPGINLVGALGLKALGASTVYVSDRWIAPWQSDYNPVFCRMMAERIRSEGKPWDAAVFERVAEKGYGGTLELVQSPAEQLAAAMPGQVDVIFSNAVLEHVVDHAQTVSSAAAITAPGGVNFHQVDFRFHEDFSRPLDHMIMSYAAYLERAKATHYEIGCQLRPFELQALFENAGFNVAWHPNAFAEDAYLDELLTQLRASDSAYKDAPAHLLKETGGLFVARKP